MPAYSPPKGLGPECLMVLEIQAHLQAVERYIAWQAARSQRYRG